MKLEIIILNENISIYRYKYNWKFTKEDILKRVEEHYIKLYGKHPTSAGIKIKCDEFDEIHRIGIDLCKSLTTLIDNEYVDKNFIYLQKNETPHSDIIPFHTHSNTFFNNRPVINDWIYCFYLQIPHNIKLNEGKISFKDNYNNIKSFLPNKGDFLIFNANLLHAPEYTPNAECDRITIVGTIAFNVKQKTSINNKNII